MIYLSQTLFPWWLAAFALGLAVALFVPGKPASGRGGVLAALALLALGGTLAYLRIAPGRAGLWLETAVLAGAAYGAGCLCGWLAGAFFTKAPVAGLLDSARENQPARKTGGAGLAARAGGIVKSDRAKPEAAPAAPADPAPAPVPAALALAAAERVAQEFLTFLRTVAREEGREGGESRQALAFGPPPAAARPQEGEDHDDLILIRGVNPEIARELNEIGVWRFSQIAGWGHEHVAWVARHLRDVSLTRVQHWPAQARVLAAGALTDYARAVVEGEAPPGCDDDAALAAWAASLPRPSPAGAGDSLYAGARPPGFSEPPFGMGDDLTRIAGVDAGRAARLNGLGVWSVGQIARWRPENARWVGAWLATPGAPERDDWIGQARAISARQVRDTRGVRISTDVIL